MLIKIRGVLVPPMIVRVRRKNIALDPDIGIMVYASVIGKSRAALGKRFFESYSTILKMYLASP